MTWVKIVPSRVEDHVDCDYPPKEEIRPENYPSGSVWKCDTCGKSWVISWTSREEGIFRPRMIHTYRWTSLFGQYVGENVFNE